MENKKIKQCGTCEKVFKKLKNNECPFCKSGNWIYGFLDDEKDLIELKGSIRK